MSEPKSSTCTRLAEVMNITHDSVNRFLLRESYEPKDLFDEAKCLLNLVGGTLSVDDSTLDKAYSQRMELPVNYRIYDKAEGKTKNDYFRDMLDEALAWGLQPDFMTGDSWYACVDNLKAVKNHRLGFMFAVESTPRYPAR